MTDSYRRPRPGPGKPLTAQRELYLRLMKLGLTNAEACRQVGINIRTGKRWRYGRRMRVNGREYAYGPISAAPPVISARFLSETERLHIADLHGPGCRSARLRPNWAEPPRRSAESCAATPTRPAAPITPTPRTGGPPVGGAVLDRENWRSTLSCAPRCNSCSTAAGAPNRSASVFAGSTPTNPNDIWCPKSFIRPSTYKDAVNCAATYTALCAPAERCADHGAPPHSRADGSPTGAHQRASRRGRRPRRTRTLGISMLLSSRLSECRRCRGPRSVLAQQCP